MRDNILLIFVKNPEPGSVKTRLAKSIGDKKACLLYRLFVEAILKRTEDRSFERLIFYYPSEKEHEIINWIGPSNIELLPQRGDDLGDRLSDAFNTAFTRGAKRVVVIGSDSPAIDTSIILHSFRELENKSCVIGPSQDGGYYLIGLSSFYSEIFQEIDWSTDRVFEQTLNTLKKSKLTFSVLDENFDVDRVEDLAFLKNRLQEASKINPKGLAPIIEALSR